MAFVSLVYPVAPDAMPAPETVGEARAHLEGVGHRVEVVLALPPGLELPEGLTESARVVEAPKADRNAQVRAGLLVAEGDHLLVLDAARAYAPEDLSRVIQTLDEGPADLVIASRRSGGSDSRAMRMLRSAAVGWLARALTGSTDPTSGLVGLTRAGLDAARDSLRGQGSQYTLELLARVPGKRIDLGIQTPMRHEGGRRGRPRPLLGDIKHLKRLADLRFGTVSRLLQFCLVGASGMVVDLTTYAGLQWVFAHTWLAGTSLPLLGRLDLLLAALAAVWLALSWNFLLNRRLTFNDARHGSILAQYLAYALSNALAITVSLWLRLWLPRSVAFFDRHKLAAAIVGIVVATGISFSMARWLVFRKQRGPAPVPAEPVSIGQPVVLTRS